jgi:cell division septum initiation protein DivIVA
MTDKELRKLTRTELLELLLAQSREIDRLNIELEECQKEIQRRKIALSTSGNIAEAALQLNRVFEAAQAAADQYLENIRVPVSDTQKQCEQMLEETQLHCNELRQSTHKAAKRIWEVIRQEMYNPKLDHTQWLKIADFIDTQLQLK